MNIQDYDWNRLLGLGYSADFVERMKDDPCWKGYAMLGTKKKGGATVPNCVKMDSKHSEGDIATAEMTPNYLPKEPATSKTELIMSESKKDGLDCNKPKAETHNGKSHVVKACYDGAPEGGKLIRFGQAGVKGSPHKEGESEAAKARRKSFQSRHAKNIAKGPSSAAYWANKVKW